MEDFFSKYRNKLSNRELPAFEEKDWQKMELLLNQQKDSNRRFGIIWWPFFIALPILAAWSWFNWTNKPDVGLLDKSTRLTETVFIHDTVYIREFIDNPRIVYIKEFDSENQLQPTTTANVDLLQTSEIEFGNAKETNNAQIGLPQQITANIRQPISIAEIPIEKIGQTEQIDENLIAQNPVLIDSIFVLPIVDPEVSLPALAGKSSIYNKIKKSITPFQILAGVHIAYPMVAESYAVNKLAYVFGIDAAALFPSNLKLSVSTQIENLYYGSESLEEGSGIVAVDPPSPDFIFNKVEISKSSFNINSNLSYHFLGMRRLKPVVGLGLSLKHASPYQVVYEFEQRQLQIDWLYETKLNPKYINSLYWSIVAGMDYQASPRWHYIFQASLLNCFNNNKHHQPDIFSMQLGLQYKFWLK